VLWTHSEAAGTILGFLLVLLVVRTERSHDLIVFASRKLVVAEHTQATQAGRQCSSLRNWVSHRASNRRRVRCSSLIYPGAEHRNRQRGWPRLNGAIVNS